MRSRHSLILLVALVVTLPAGLASGADCRRHACSNDTAPGGSGADPVLGDERMAWDGPADWSWRSCSPDEFGPCTPVGAERCYEIASWPDLEIQKRQCETTVWTGSAWAYYPPATFFDPYKLGPLKFPRIGETLRFVVRACEGPDCGEWGPRKADGSQDWVEFLGGDYFCLGTGDEGRCEKACYFGGPTILPGLPDC